MQPDVPLRSLFAASAEVDAALTMERFFAEAIPQQVWTAKPDGQLDFVNDRVLKYFEASEADVLGAGWQAVIHPDDLPRCIALWTHSLKTGEPYEVEFRLRRPDGSYLWHLGRALAVRDSKGRIVKWFGTNTDIDEVKCARDELERRATFEQQLIGIVSHDLRDPLNAIGLAASLLRTAGPLDDKQSKLLTRIDTASDRAGRLIRDLLDFTSSRFTGTIPIRPADANFREIVDQVMGEMRILHPLRSATIAHEGSQNGRWDTDRISQVVTNLVGNAFQHSTEGSEIVVKTCGEPSSVSLEVKNASAPISESDRARLFSPFERGVEAAQRRGRSVGLGLFIADQIVKAHEGMIELSSTAEGTTFRVVLPRHPRERAPETLPETAGR